MSANEITALDAVALSEAIKERKVSCVEVMDAYLDRIERLNPLVNAIVSMRERNSLIAEARECDAELARGEYRGWMHGFPHAVKDLEPTVGIRTTLGSPIFRNFIAKTDSILVERIKGAGAIIIGKTNVPEFGLGSQSYNQIFGATLNPYDTSKTCGGSSGGAAVAVALRMAPVADGSDHGGSLRNPAAFNNIFGFRTSFGRVPSDIHEVFMPSLSVHGPLARNIPDLGHLLCVIAGYDPRVPLSIREDPAKFLTPLDRDFNGVRIAWSGDFGGYLPFEPGVLELCDRAVETFVDLGCIVEEAAPDFPVEEVWRNWLKIRAWQVCALLKAPYSDPKRRAMLKPEAQWEVECGLRISASEIADASVVRTRWYQAVRAMFEKYDYWVLPAGQVFPFEATTHWPKEINGRTMDTYHRWMEVMIPVTMSGCPSLAVPAGFNSRRLPMGIQIVAPNYGEFACLQLAHAYDAVTGWVRKYPPPIGDL